MTIEVLLATMNQKDDSLLKEMKIHTDVIVCNQNSVETSYHKYEYQSHSIRWYNLQEKGVGLNRNNTLFRSTADICLVADDDLVYADDYDKTVINAFDRYQKADVILFNIMDADGTKRMKANKPVRIRWYNCGKYGAVQIGFRRLSVMKNAICFNQLFGGGTTFTAGEDTMFIRECIRKGLKVVAVPDCILRLENKRPSTWFEGYNHKFFEDLGTSYRIHFGKMASACALFQLVRHRKKWLTQYSVWEAWKFARIGIEKYRLIR